MHDVTRENQEYSPDAIVAMLRDSEFDNSMALTVIRACLSVSRVYAASDAGIDFAKRANTKIYCLSFARRLALSIPNDDGYLARITNILLEQLNGPNRRQLVVVIKHHAEHFPSDIRFLRRSLTKDFSADQVAGFLAEVETILSV